MMLKQIWLYPLDDWKKAAGIVGFLVDNLAIQ
jgi:hypothetical protein